MTSFAILWFFNFHRLVTTKTLAMIRAKEPRLVRLGFVERFSMTTLAQRRRDTHRAVVVAPLTHDVLVTVEVRRDLTIANVLQQSVYYLAMRELDWLVLLSEESDRH